MDAALFITLLVPASYFSFLITERLWPARAFPHRPGWQWMGIGFLLLFTTIGIVLPLLIPEDWLTRYRLFDLTGLGVIGGTVVGLVVTEGFVYAWHRTAHNVGFLWRGFHQLHHSPRQIDIPGSQVFHPTEMAVYTLLPLAVTVVVLGLDPLAASLTGFCLALLGYFQHWNMHTPQWIGYIFQRPESHCVHHRTGVHSYNYADLPLWDILFGTFRNPREFRGECGFEADADRRMGAMFAFADVNAPLYGPGSRGAKPRSATQAHAPQAGVSPGDLANPAADGP